MIAGGCFIGPQFEHIMKLHVHVCNLMRSKHILFEFVNLTFTKFTYVCVCFYDL